MEHTAGTGCPPPVPALRPVPLASNAHRTAWMVTEPAGPPSPRGGPYSGLAAGAGSWDGAGGGVEGGGGAGITAASGMMNQAMA